MEINFRLLNLKVINISNTNLFGRIVVLYVITFIKYLIIFKYLIVTCT